MATHTKELRVSESSLTTNPSSLLNKHSKHSRVTNFPDITVLVNFFELSPHSLRTTQNGMPKRFFIYFLYLIVQEFFTCSWGFCLFVYGEAIN